ncbi:hypothetical protein [Prevotella falsenii]|uniref:hypothetical protein n=1 Tax=Prevotella falsenii TaxID=515414 RepID=UPI0012EBC313|nr:hypothetical protein [Prevotella falsenii]
MKKKYICPVSQIIACQGIERMLAGSGNGNNASGSIINPNGSITEEIGTGDDEDGEGMEAS